MQEWSGFTAAGAVLASALGCGLLMGIERERRKGAGPFRSLAGVRSFTLASLAGAAAALTGSPPLVAVVALFVAGLGITAYARDRSGDPGVTTEIALLLAYLIGVLCVRDQVLAAALAVTVTGLLASRDGLHRFARQWLQPSEVRSGLVLAGLLLLVAPLVPHTPLWGGLLNPAVVMRLLLVLLLIQSLAHLGGRLLQARHAVALSALASGFVSSTATIASLGMQARDNPAAARGYAGAALLSCVATMAQILVVASAVQPLWLARLWAPALAGAAVAVAWGWAFAHSNKPQATAPAHTGSAISVAMPQRSLPPDKPLFNLRDALVIATLLSGIQAGVQMLTRWQGDAGMLAGALLASLADVHAACAALLVQGGPQSPFAQPIARALMAALLVHGASKCVVGVISGGWPYARALAPGVAAHTLAFLGVLALRP